MPDLTDPAILNAFIATGAMAVACAILSVFVVARRWAFMGEGISHSGFGGAGTAWMLAVIWPDVFLDPVMPYVFVLLFCFGAAMGIGWLSAAGRVTSDAAIGVFLVASLAWGFVGQSVFVHHFGEQPSGFENLLFGQVKAVGGAYTLASVSVALLVAGVAWSMSKELIAYCFDPMLARTSGVRAGFVHFILMLMMATAIVIGIRVVGSVLVTALLVLPAASANLISKRLSRVMTISIATALVGAWGGIILNTNLREVPVGSLIVLVLFAQFLIALATARVKRG